MKSCAYLKQYEKSGKNGTEIDLKPIIQCISSTSDLSFFLIFPDLSSIKFLNINKDNWDGIIGHNLSTRITSVF